MEQVVLENHIYISFLSCRVCGDDNLIIIIILFFFELTKDGGGEGYPTGEVQVGVVDLDGPYGDGVIGVHDGRETESPERQHQRDLSPYVDGWMDGWMDG